MLLQLFGEKQKERETRKEEIKHFKQKIIDFNQYKMNENMRRMPLRDLNSLKKQSMQNRKTFYDLFRQTKFYKDKLTHKEKQNIRNCGELFIGKQQYNNQKIKHKKVDTQITNQSFNYLKKLKNKNHDPAENILHKNQTEQKQLRVLHNTQKPIEANSLYIIKINQNDITENKQIDIIKDGQTMPQKRIFSESVLKKKRKHESYRIKLGKKQLKQLQTPKFITGPWEQTNHNQFFLNQESYIQF